MKSAKVTLIIALVTLLTACDTKYGVIRSTKISGQLDHHCLKQSLESVPEVSNIKYTLLGKNRSGETFYERHRYTYLGDNIPANLSVLVNQDRSTVFHTRISTQEIPQQEDIDRIRQVMDKVEKAMLTHCGIAKHPVQIMESCYKVNCP